MIKLFFLYSSLLVAFDSFGAGCGSHDFSDQRWKDIQSLLEAPVTETLSSKSADPLVIPELDAMIMLEPRFSQPFRRLQNGMMERVVRLTHLDYAPDFNANSPVFVDVAQPPLPKQAKLSDSLFGKALLQAGEKISELAIPSEQKQLRFKSLSRLASDFYTRVFYSYSRTKQIEVEFRLSLLVAAAQNLIIPFFQVGEDDSPLGSKEVNETMKEIALREAIREKEKEGIDPENFDLDSVRVDDFLKALADLERV